jgi:CubicO group peptidase (beta-lactamase class C family)
LQERLFEPLGMNDTSFHVPKEKWQRFASYYKRDDKGELALVSPDAPVVNRGFDREPSMPSGGGGLVSTAGDYLKFSQMLLNGGQLKGVRILGPETVRMLSANHLSESFMTDERGGGIVRPGLGFGFGFAVFTNPGLASNPTGVGSYYWGGAAGTWFWIDPTHDIVFVGMVQHSGDPNTWALRELSQQMIYQALLEPKK